MNIPRRRKPKANSVTKAFVIRVEHDDWLTEQARKTGATKSAVIRIVLDAVMDRKEDKVA